MPDWVWQVKVNDERGMLRIRDGALHNRHGVLLARNKAQYFAAACENLCREYHEHRWLDLGLIGFREVATFGAGARGAVIVFDVPSMDPWLIRRDLLVRRLPPIDLIAREKPISGMVYRFSDHDHAEDLFDRTRGIPGLEGIIGRHLNGPYVQGDAETMVKVKWRN
jgi:hypothetical protein